MAASGSSVEGRGVHPRVGPGRQSDCRPAARLRRGERAQGIPARLLCIPSLAPAAERFGIHVCCFGGRDRCGSLAMVCKPRSSVYLGCGGTHVYEMSTAYYHHTPIDYTCACLASHTYIHACIHPVKVKEKEKSAEGLGGSVGVWTSPTWNVEDIHANIKPHTWRYSLKRKEL